MFTIGTILGASDIQGCLVGYGCIITDDGYSNVHLWVHEHAGHINTFILLLHTGSGTFYGIAEQTIKKYIPKTNGPRCFGAINVNSWCGTKFREKKIIQGVDLETTMRCIRAACPDMKCIHREGNKVRIVGRATDGL